MASLAVLPSLSLTAWLLIAATGSFAWVWRRSLPMAWTIRIFWIQYCNQRKAKAGRRAKQEKVTASEPHLLMSRLPVPGTDIFDEVYESHHVASVDECDFNGHLSNSSYPKNFDYARTDFATNRFIRGGMDGGWTALGGTSFRFLKEIPINKRYSVRCRIHSWDDKWVYVVGEYVSYSRKTKSETLHCVAMGRACTKAGRKTIPPWLFFALCGYSPRSSTTGVATAASNWSKAEALRTQFLQEKRGQLAKKGKTLKRDAWYAGGGYGSSTGVLKRYDPLPKGVSEGDANDVREGWMKKAYWDVEGWEQERREKMQTLSQFTLLGN